MTQLTREQAFDILAETGWPTGPFKTNMGETVPFKVLVVAIGGAESDLMVEAQGPPNRDGSIDRGWKQINSVHGYDPELLLSDPVYTARAALQILLQQGVRAWSAYGVKNAEGAFPYVRRLPPLYGGPVVRQKGTHCREIAKTVQAGLNPFLGSTKLVVDGLFGPKSEAALKSATGSAEVDAKTWERLALR